MVYKFEQMLDITRELEKAWFASMRAHGKTPSVAPPEPTVSLKSLISTGPSGAHPTHGVTASRPAERRDSVQTGSQGIARVAWWETDRPYIHYPAEMGRTLHHVNWHGPVPYRDPLERDDPRRDGTDRHSPPHTYESSHSQSFREERHPYPGGPPPSGSSIVTHGHRPAPAYDQPPLSRLDTPSSKDQVERPPSRLPPILPPQRPFNSFTANMVIPAFKKASSKASGRDLNNDTGSPRSGNGAIPGETPAIDRQDDRAL
jgi:hypothetical protein